MRADFDDCEGVMSAFAEDWAFSADGFEAGTGKQGITDSIRSSREAFGTTIHTPHYVLIEFQHDDHATGLVGAHLRSPSAGA